MGTQTIPQTNTINKSHIAPSKHFHNKLYRGTWVWFYRDISIANKCYCYLQYLKDQNIGLVHSGWTDDSYCHKSDTGGLVKTGGVSLKMESRWIPRCSQMESSPVTLCGIDDWQAVLPFDAHLILSRLQVALECINTPNVEPNVLLRQKNTCKCSLSLYCFMGVISRLVVV